VNETFGRVPRPGWEDTRAPERQPCACGSDVTRAPYEAIATAVGRHNRTPQHRRWWDRVSGAWQ
jgi:hypothetical protein